MCNNRPSLTQSFYKDLFQDLHRKWEGRFDTVDQVENIIASEQFLMEMFSNNGVEATIGLLSSLGKSFERALIGQGAHWEFPSGPFDSFPGTNLPYFLYCFTSQIFFDDGTARYHTTTYPAGYVTALAVACTRQVLLAFSKADDIPVNVSEADEISAFVDRVCNPRLIKHAVHGRALNYARLLIRDLFYENGELDASVAQYIQEPFGTHGPGAVAGGEKGAEKWQFNYVVGQDQRIFHSQPDQHGQDLVPDQEDKIPRRSRLAVVPKDFRGHRLICIEPKELMFAQQGLMRLITDLVHRHPLTKRCINFSNQVPSQIAARRPGCATIDLSDASDRVSIALARLLLPREIFKLLTRVRSNEILLPDGEIVTNVKTLFTMGNALCFPVETIVFWAISLGTILEDEYPLSPSFVNSVIQSRQIGKIKDTYLRVFGDDIVVSSSRAESICQSLESSGLVVNAGKTCIKTAVREACGSWWFHGCDAVITKLRCTSVKSPLDWISVVEYATALHNRQFYCTAVGLLEIADEFHPAPWHLLGFLIQVSKSGPYRWNSELQRVEYQTLTYPVSSRVLPCVEGLYAFYTGNATRTVTGRGCKAESVWTGL
jgi:hypothetical protein